MLMPIDRKFCDCSTLYMTCFKIVNNVFQTSNQILCFPWAISELFSIASASVITFILKAIVYEERCAFGTMRKITARREILNWNNCQFTVTESIVVFLQSHGSDYIFTDSLFSFVFILVHELLCSVSHFPMISVKFADSNGWLQSRILHSAYSWWFCLFFFWTTQVCWKVLNY